MAEFKDLYLVGLDDKASSPSGIGALTHFVLKLSGNSTGQWSALFNTAWQHNLSMDKRRASAMGSTIEVTCTHEELQGLIDQFKVIINEVNAECRKRIAQEEENRKAAAEKRANEERRITELKDTLKF